jgi:hypothetical protein
VSRIVKSVEKEGTGISRKFESQGVVVRLMRFQETDIGKQYLSWSTKVTLLPSPSLEEKLSGIIVLDLHGPWPNLVEEAYFEVDCLA